MNIRSRLNELLDVMQMSVEAVIMSPIIIGCLIERFFEWLGKIADDAVLAHENYEKLEFELREAKIDAWAANLVLKDANEGWKKERIRRCRLLYEYCKLRWENEGRERTLFWLKWQDRWIVLERYYKEIDLNGEEEND